MVVGRDETTMLASIGGMCGSFYSIVPYLISNIESSVHRLVSCRSFFTFSSLIKLETHALNLL